MKLIHNQIQTQWNCNWKKWQKEKYSAKDIDLIYKVSEQKKPSVNLTQ